MAVKARAAMLLLIISALVSIALLSGVTAEAKLVVHYVGLEDGVVEGGHLEWLPCNGSLVPFYRYVYVAPPGVQVGRVVIEPVETSVFSGVLPPAGLAAGFRGETVVYRNVTCHAPIIEKGYWRGIQITVILYPMVVDNRVLVKKLRIVLSLEKGPSKLVALTPQDVQLLREIADNPEVYSITPTLPPGSLGILIVTRDYFMPVVKEWARLKELQGYRVKIIDIDRDVCASPTMVSSLGLRKAIRNYIKFVYEKCKGCYHYLIIIGDTSGLDWNRTIRNCSSIPKWEVPTAYFYNPASAFDLQASHTGYFVPSDVYYATLDGDWDANNNGILGEYPQDVSAYDPFPEMIYARIPVRSLTEAKLVLMKLEKIYPTKYRIVLMGSIIKYLNEDNESGQAQGDTRVEVMYDRNIRPLNWLKPVRLYEHYPVYTSIISPGDINGNLTAENVKLVLSGSPSMVIASAHGDPFCLWRKVWVKDTNNDGKPESSEIKYEPFLCASDAPLLKQQLLYLVQACLTAYFDMPNGDSLGEVMVKQGSQYIGMSRISFTTLLPPGEAVDPNKWAVSDLLYYYITYYLFDRAERSVNRIGDALLDAIIKFVTLEPLDMQGYLGNATRRVFFALAYFGDPTRMIYSMPTRINATSLAIAAPPHTTVSFSLQLLRGDGQPLVKAPIQLYDVSFGSYMLLTVQYTNDNGVAFFHVTVDTYNRSLYAYYPGNPSIPTPTEPSGVAITVQPVLTKPWISVEPQVYEPGETLHLHGCGFPYNSPLEVYVEGVYITRVYSDSQGCINADIVPPYTILPPRRLRVEVIYPYYPLIRASASFVLAYNPVLDLHRIGLYLQQQVDNLYSLLQETYNALLKAEDMLASLNKNITKRVNTINASLENLYDILRALAHGLAGLNKTIRLINRNLPIINKTVAENNAKLMELTGLLNRVSSMLHILEAQLASLNKSLGYNTEALQSKIQVIRSEVSMLLNTTRMLYRKALDIALSLNNTLAARLIALQGSLDAMRERLNRVLQTVELLSARTARLEAAIREINASLAGLSSRVSLLSGKVEEVLETLGRRIDNVNTRISTLEGKLLQAVSESYSKLYKSVAEGAKESERINREVTMMAYVVYAILAASLATLALTIIRKS